MPTLQLIQDGANLNQNEVIRLKEVGFSFCQQHKCFPWNFFGSESLNVFMHQLLNANSWPIF
jgi:hypothetical protein